MIPASFQYHRPASVAEALRLLAKHGDDAKVLAGGHSLLPAMKLRVSTPGHLIDIGHLENLKYIKKDGNYLVIGAATTHSMIESSAPVRRQAAALAQAAAVIGDPQVRNMGTIGGSLAHADPAADYPAAVLALGAQLKVRGPRKQRTIPAEEFFVDLYTTALEPGEIITEVRVPVVRAGQAYAKFPHPASRFAVVGCAAVLAVKKGLCAQARVAFTGIAGAAFRDQGVEEALTGQALDEAAIAEAASRAADGRELLSDAFASEEYRRHLARVFARRALTQALQAA
jgi:carbon-monoxide dehydrogenase medium subunit